MIIDHSKFVSYTLNFNGVNFITTNYDRAVKQLQNLAHGTIYGNKDDGTRTMIDNK